MSNIEWTDRTWNTVVGCTPVSPGCLNCYAASMAVRLEGMGVEQYQPREVPATMGTPYDAHEPAKTIRIAEKRGGRAVFTGDVRLVPERLAEPLSWRKPCRIFANSMSDPWHEKVPFEHVDKMLAIAALCPQHDFILLTKRPERMAEYSSGCHARVVGAIDRLISDTPRRRDESSNRWMSLGVPVANKSRWPLPNVWLGTSVENQEQADKRIPHLLKCPAAVRFLSCEPLLGALDLCNVGEYDGRQLCALVDHPCVDDEPGGCGIDWVIVGGESGAHARPCDVAWVRSIVRQCKDAGVPCFVKQLGKWPTSAMTETQLMPVMPNRWDDSGENLEVWFSPRDRKGGDPAEWPEDLRVREWPATRSKEVKPARK